MKETILIIFFFIFGLNALPQQHSNQLIGIWQLDSISYKNSVATNIEGQEQFRNVYTAALYNQLNDEQRLDIYELEQVNEKASGFLELFYQTEIEFQTNRAFYNRSKISEHTTSGEYLLDCKKLLMEWETAEKNTFKILKLDVSELIVKDLDLRVTYYYKPKIN